MSVMQRMPSSVSSVLTSLLKLLIPFVNTQPAVFAVRHLRQVDVRSQGFVCLKKKKIKFWKNQNNDKWLVPSSRPQRMVRLNTIITENNDLVLLWDQLLSIHFISFIKGPFWNTTVLISEWFFSTRTTPKIFPVGFQFYMKVWGLYSNCKILNQYKHDAL